MGIRILASTAAVAALLATTITVPAFADDNPSLTVTGVVAVVADSADGDVASIIAGNTVVSVQPDAVAGLAPGTTVRASLAIPADTAADLNVTADISVDSAKGEAVVQAADEPFAVESVARVAAAAPLPGVHYVDVAVNTTAYAGAVRPTETQIRAAIADASAYWVANTGGAFPGFELRTYRAYASTLSCAATDDAWWQQAADQLGVNLDDYVATASGEHLILIGECSLDAKAALGTVGTSLTSGGLVLTQADAFSSTGYLTYLNGLLIHELGHNFSLEHANGPNLDGCTFASVPAYAQIANCGTADYADDYSLMGFGMPMANAPLLDVARREQLGVIDSTALKTQAAGTTATYALNALGASGGIKGIKLTVASGTYYVEFRNGTGEPDADYLYADGCVAEWEPSPTCTVAKGIWPYGPGVRVMLLAADKSTRVEAVHSQIQDSKFGEFGLDSGDWFISKAGDVNLSVDSVAGDTATITVTTASVPRVAVASATLWGGTPTLGVPISVVVGTLAPADATLTYRWFRSGVEIAGASGPIYTPVAADAGKTLTARVEARAAGKAPAQALAKQPAAPTMSAPRVGVAALATVAWPAGVGLAYQWLLDGVAISGADAASYLPSVSDYGHQLSVRVTGTHATLGAMTLTSLAVTVGKGTLNPPTPTISGTALVGHTLSAVRGTWPAGATFTYRWYANGSPISGATGSSYKVASSVAGKKVTVEVTGTVPAYNPAWATSEPKGVPIVGKATITGIVQQNHTLTAHHGTWLSGTTFTYQWYASGVAIPGATKSTFWLTSARVGKTMTVRIVGRKAGFTPVGVSSARTSRVAR